MFVLWGAVRQVGLLGMISTNAYILDPTFPASLQLSTPSSYSTPHLLPILLVSQLLFLPLIPTVDLTSISQHFISFSVYLPFSKACLKSLLSHQCLLVSKLLPKLTLLRTWRVENWLERLLDQIYIFPDSWDMPTFSIH